ncbi:MAG: hypothetical protein NTX33_18320, partial [Propionibacteriales bacterium]|nr:hypothetical protein [Propionibacteriales bacterium]
MSSSLPRRRSALRVLVVLVLGLVATLMALPGASAHNFDGQLQVRGTGSNYAGANSDTALAVAPGATATYYVKVLNKGTTESQYRLALSADPALTVAVTAGSLVVSSMAGNYNDGYFTPPIKPGASLAVTIKITVPAGSLQRTYLTYVDLFNAGTYSFTHLSRQLLYTEVKAPATTTSTGLFVRNGSLPFVGGAVTYQRAGAPAIKVGQTSTFTVRLRNDSNGPEQIQASIGSPCAAFTVVSVKLGNVDVTQAWKTGTYVTPVLAKGVQKDYTAIVKYLAADPNCSLATTLVSSYGYGDGVGSYQYLVTPGAV